MGVSEVRSSQKCNSEIGVLLALLRVLNPIRLNNLSSYFRSVVRGNLIGHGGILEKLVCLVQPSIIACLTCKQRQSMVVVKCRRGTVD